ncbi:hypothetical protein F5X68DRAFT_275937 [Plectosphaerella plurivora]|uniref:Uncharacterized protein n=1 Tax=Plectosphaerella plurivora TaxID=936078 RepID=A0A9P8VCE6_9PEZI|nr:hypothetical protein F5X68DRAFT_275937 [Plectosphaerella plurivora]
MTAPADAAAAAVALGPPATLASSQPFVGCGSDYQLSPKSQWLFHQYSTFSVRGQTPSERGGDVGAVRKTSSHPGLLHGSLVVAACQWAWVTGSLDHVKVPFLHHKAAAYEFVRQQVLDETQVLSETTTFAIATLALAEGAVGDLDASSKHLRGLQELALRRRGYKVAGPNLPQQMLDMAADRLRKGKVSVLQEVIGATSYQPTIIALLFTSLWDLANLPPKEAPRYGWWQANETLSDRLWQGYTKNLDWEISRDFDPDRNISMMLNSDPKSSRASYIATFFYLLIAMNDTHVDCVLTVWLLEQLIEDVEIKEQDMISGAFSRHLWFWSVLLGAAVADVAAPSSPDEARQVAVWKTLYAGKIRLASGILRLKTWEDARRALAEIAWAEDSTAGEAGLRGLWEKAMSVKVYGSG